MVPITDRDKVLRYLLGLTIETNNFAFEVKVILGLESTRPDGWVAGLAGNIAISAQLELELRLSLAIYFLA